MAIVIPIIAKFIDEGLDKAKKSVAEAQTGWEKTGAAMESLAGPAKAIIAGMAGAGVAVAKNAGAAAKANKMLEASFKAVGYPENAKAAEAYAESLQHVIGVSDEEIKKTMQKLAAFSDVAKSQELMADATQAAADMSAAGFGTMDSAATALGKALQNPTKALGSLTRMGVTFTDQQKEQIKTMVEAGDTAGAQALIMKEVEGTFSGVAEASASGTAKMKLAWDEAAETLGTVLVPVLGIVNIALTALAGFVQENSKLVLILAGVVTGLAVAVLAVNAAIKVANAVMAIAKAVQVAWSVATKAHIVVTKAYVVAQKLATAAAKVFNIVMKSMAGPIGIIIALVGLLAVIIIKNWDKIKEVTQRVWNWIKTFLVDLWETLKEKVRTVFDWIKEKIGNVWDAIKNIFTKNPFEKVVTQIDDLKEAVRLGWEAVKTIISNKFGEIPGLLTANPFTKFQGWLTDLKGWFTGAFADILGAVRGLVRDIQSAIAGIKSAVSAAAKAIDKIKPGGNAAGAQSATAFRRALALPVAATIANGVPVPQARTVARQEAGGGGVTINITGALDPERVARQVRQLLDNHDRRQGRTTLRAVAF